MRIATTALVVALAAAGAARADLVPQDIPGTWECYGPGQHSAHTPPIVYFSPLSSAESGGQTVFVDGFARSVTGTATLAAEPGVLRVSAGDARLVLRQAGPASRIAHVSLEREGVGQYDCYRLPRIESEVALNSAPAAAPDPAAAPAPAPRVYQPIERSFEPMKVPGLD